MNAKIGAQVEGEEGIVGRHALVGERNENGDKFVDFCASNNVAITSTMFPHRDVHKYTWTSPDGKTKNQIDHFAIGGKFKGSVMDTRCYRGADIFSDHNLGIAKMKLKLCRVTKMKNTRRKYELNMLEVPEVKRRYNLEVKNRLWSLN